jgi:hypothetical protein
MDGNESHNSPIPGDKYILILFTAHKFEPDKSELKIPVPQQQTEHGAELPVHIT